MRRLEHVASMRKVSIFRPEKCEGLKSLEDLGVDGMLLLKLILRE